MGSEEAEDWYFQHVLPNKTLFIRVATRVLGDADRAEDIVQDVLTEMLSDERWKVVPRAKMYIIRSIYNRCYNYLRRLKIVPMRSFAEREELFLADDSPDALQILEGRDTMSRVLDALETLPPRTKLVFTLSTIGNLSVQQIAKRFGTDDAVVRRQIKRGRYLLTKALQDAEAEAQVSITSEDASGKEVES